MNFKNIGNIGNIALLRDQANINEIIDCDEYNLI